MLVGLAAIEDGTLEHPSSEFEGSGHDAEADVRRVERVMTERRQQEAGGGRPVHVRHRTKGRLAHRTAGNRQRRRLVHVQSPGRRQAA